MQEVENVQNANNIHEVMFEERDTQIFSIPETKTRLSTLQNYFFPRLEMLLSYTLNIVAQVYDVNPYERMTFVYCPSHRDKAKENKDFGTVHIGVSAKRDDKPLKIIKRNGQPFVFHPTYLTFKVLPSGTIHVELLPFRQGVDDAYVARISALVEKYNDVLLPLLSLAHISHTSDVSYCEFIPLYQAISPEEVGSLGIKLVSPRYHFPVDLKRGLYELILAFTLLYSLAESFICIGEGREPELEKMLEQFKVWYVRQLQPQVLGWSGRVCPIRKQRNEMLFIDLGSTKENMEAALKEDTGAESLNLKEIPKLNSYSFVRAGKWWAVLARDQWKCLSCGRSARGDGVLLEVDHIVPRSRGGSDDMSNLQTLCKKCNVGKSNKDSTRLCVSHDGLMNLGLIETIDRSI